MHKTKNDLSAGIRKKSIDLLSKCLADAIDLKLQSKQAHWNVKGPSFIALHELFDTIATAGDSYADIIAERIIQLGGIADGTVQGT
ncbi:MAG: ferritin-like domain-containing protein, partial [Pyrinomonadaceae bacterium]